jgi:hypothetical protein
MNTISPISPILPIPSTSSTSASPPPPADPAPVGFTPSDLLSKPVQKCRFFAKTRRFLPLFPTPLRVFSKITRTAPIPFPHRRLCPDSRLPKYSKILEFQTISFFIIHAPSFIPSVHLISHIPSNPRSAVPIPCVPDPACTGCIPSTISSLRILCALLVPLRVRTGRVSAATPHAASYFFASTFPSQLQYGIIQEIAQNKQLCGGKMTTRKEGTE